MWGLCYDPESKKAAILGHFPENQETLNTSWVFDDIKAQSIDFVTCHASFVVTLKKVLIEIHKKVFWASQVALVVKNPSANAGDSRNRVWSRGWENPLEKGIATHYSILAWRISWTEEPGGLWSDTIEQLNMRMHKSIVACLFPHSKLEAKNLFFWTVFIFLSLT